jgi:hypothetical protein
MKQLFAAAFAFALLAAPAAQAFTMEGQSATNSDGSARYADPKNRFSDQKDGKTLYENGNTSIRFGTGGAPNQNYNPSSMFEPNGRPQTER